jgi:hypothetical protein
VIGGSVTFVDRLDATGFSGLGGAQNVAIAAGEAGSPLPTAGTVSDFQARAGSTVGGSGVVFTLFKNGAATAATCTVAAGGSTCTDTSDTITFAADDVIAVRIQNNSSGFIRDARWAATLATT